MLIFPSYRNSRVSFCEQRSLAKRKTSVDFRLLAYAGVLSLVGLTRLNAEDVVYLKPTTGNRAATRVAGTITEYTGRELLIRTASGRESMM